MCLVGPSVNSKASGLQMGPLIQMRVEFKNVWHGGVQETEKRMSIVMCVVPREVTTEE